MKISIPPVKQWWMVETEFRRVVDGGIWWNTNFHEWRPLDVRWFTGCSILSRREQAPFYPVLE